MLFLAAVGFAFSRRWLWIPAGTAVLVAFTGCVPRRRQPLVCGLAGALGAQVVLRWPSAGFHGLTAIAAAAAVLPALISGWHDSSRRVRRGCAIATGGLFVVLVVLAVPVVVGALSARGRLESGMDLAKSSVSAFEAGQSDQAKAVVGRAAADLGGAHDTLAAWWNLGGYAVPVLAQQERALTGGAAAGAHLTSVVSAESGALDLSGLRFHDGRIDVAALEALRVPTTRVDQAVIAAQRRLDGVNSPWLVHPITTRLASFDTEMARFRSDADTAVLAAKDGPALLGADGVRHYFVAFMTPAETRGLGGFLGAYGILTVDDGSVTLSQSGRPIQLTAAGSSSWHIDGPASFLERYGKFDPQVNFEDLSYPPDMPTVGQVISQLYPQVAGGTTVDGVLVLDPYGLASLLELTGPVDVPGLGQLTSANAAPLLLRQQYLDQSLSNDERHDFLQDALSAGFHRLTSEALPSPKTIGSTLGPVVKEGRLLFWSSHPADGPLLNSLDLSGAFPDREGGDLLAVTQINAANDKLDAYLHQTVTDSVDYDSSTGQVDSTVTIGLQNSGSTSLPQYVAGSYTGSGLPYGTDQIWLSIYSPLALKAVSVDGQRDSSFSGPTAEDGVYAYSGWVKIAAGTSIRVVATFAGKVAPGGYTITARLQPLANPQTFSVDLASPAGGSWTAGTDQVQRHSWPVGAAARH